MVSIHAGDAAEDLVVGYGNIEKQYRGFVSLPHSIFYRTGSHYTILLTLHVQVHSLNTDFIVPLETKLEAEERGLTVC